MLLNKIAFKCPSIIIIITIGIQTHSILTIVSTNYTLIELPPGVNRSIMGNQLFPRSIISTIIANSCNRLRKLIIKRNYSRRPTNTTIGTYKIRVASAQD